MDLIQTILITAFTLAVLIAFHEFGHFWVARRCGIKVLRFSIGFGKPLFSWRDKQDTEYVLSALPLGGYVKMLDEREAPVAEAERHRSFNAQPVWQRLAVVSAGPIANFILAIAVYWLLFMSGVSGLSPQIGEIKADSVAERAGLQSGYEIVSIDGEATPTRQLVQQALLSFIGETTAIPVEYQLPDSTVRHSTNLQVSDWLADEEAPDLLAALGIAFYQPNIDVVIAEVLPDGAAAAAGLQAGDRVLRANDLDISDWQQWVSYVQARAGESIAIEYEREGRLLQTSLIPQRKTAENGEVYGQVGMRVQVPEWPESMRREFSYSPLSAIGAAAGKTWAMSVFTLDAIKKMLVGLISPKNLSGPITIAKVASASASVGLEAYLGFLALLSVSLGVLNLLPIPVLDGGHIVYCLVEWVTGKPVPEKIQIIGYQVGAILILGVMMLALYNDLLRL